ncbi:hypothetical protein [Acidaminococcus provencensis]|uniref:hypothetical protein n=1 Tax=Acidaminococcus provencensis TaxID=2058289 RepID=UPI0022E160CF|nr:hypothetical protein [Acidaminococcus provencensis]
MYREYFLFRYHHIDPVSVERMPFRDRAVLLAFAAYEIRERNAEIKKQNAAYERQKGGMNG